MVVRLLWREKVAQVPLALADAVLAGLTEDFFVSDCPGDACDRNRQHEKPNYLIGNRHTY